MKKTNYSFSIEERIKQLLLQILLLPLSTIVTVGGAWIIWYTIFYLVMAPEHVFLAFLGGAFSSIITVPIAYMAFMAISSIKRVKYLPEADEGTWYRHDEKVSHNIYDKSGCVVGSYETIEQKDSYEMSAEEKKNLLKLFIIFLTSFPCRVVSIIAAIIACFTNDKFFVSIKRPINFLDYDPFMYKYFDIVTIDKNKQYITELINEKRYKPALAVLNDLKDRSYYKALSQEIENRILEDARIFYESGNINDAIKYLDTYGIDNNTRKAYSFVAQGKYCEAANLGLSHIVIPSEVLVIYKIAPNRVRFKGIKSIVISGKAQRIEDWAFSGLCDLEYIVIPKSINSFGYDVFYNCDNLKDIYYYGNENEWKSVAKFRFKTKATCHYNFNGKIHSKK